MTAPYEDEAISFNAGVNNAGDYWVSVASRRIETATTVRGRQYELDTVQTGEYHATYDNRDGALSPMNGSSPYSPNVVPYRPIRKRMQWPPTQNMLHANQASSGEALTVGAFSAPVAPGSTVPRVYGAYGNPVVAGSSTAFEGSQVLQVNLPSTVAANFALVYMTAVSVLPGQPHTFSVYVRTPVGTAALGVAATIQWLDTNSAALSAANGSLTMLPVASNTWTRLTVTSTAPAKAAGMWVGVTSQNAPGASATFQCDGAQLEYAAAPTAYTKPSTWYPLFAGFVERWPQRWDQNGLFRKSDVVAVDHFGYLSQTILKPPFYADMLATAGIRFFYTFDVGKAANYVNDLSHNRGSAQLVTSQYGAGSWTFGNTITAANQPNSNDPVAGVFLGGANSVATVGNTSSSSNAYLPATFIDLTTAPGYVAPAGDSSGWYTRIIAFRTAAGYAPYIGTLWGWLNPAFTNAYASYAGGLYISTGSGTVGITSDVYTQFGTANANDGNWHFAAVRVNPSTGQIAGWLDGTDGSTHTTYSSYATMLSGSTDAVGVQVVSGSNKVGYGFTGDIAFVAEFGGYLSNVTLASLWTSWKNAWLYDSATQRYSRVLGWIGFNGSSNLAANPATVYMGPATDITAGGQAASTYSPTTGTDAQTALQNIVTTENGNQFADAAGTLTFQARSARYGARTPSIVFGEQTANGEIPYEDVKFDFDPTRIANDVQITRYLDSAIYEAFAPASQAANGTRTLTRTINVTAPAECTDASNWFTYRYGNADLRMQTLRIHLSANPGAWATMLALECGTKARVMRRDLAGAVQWDGFVEKISWSLDYAQNEVFVDLEMSPADLQAVWMLAAAHTTLQNAVTVTTLNSNTGFETGLSPWAVTGGTVAQSAVRSHSGTYSAQLTPSGSAAQVYIQSEQVAVTAGNAYAARCWVWFTNAVTSNFSMSVNWFDSTHTYLSTSSVTVSATAGAWQQVVNSFTAPASAAYASLVPTLSGTPAAGQVWYVDDCSLTNSVTSITLNPFPNASTLPVASWIPGNFTGGSGATVNCGGYSEQVNGGTMTYSAPAVRLGAGTGTWEEIAVTSYTSVGGTQVQNYSGQNVPGQYVNYTAVTVTLAAPIANSYAAGATVSEALPPVANANQVLGGLPATTLPNPFTDPTAHDVDSVLGTTTIIGY